MGKHQPPDEPHCCGERVTSMGCHGTSLHRHSAGKLVSYPVDSSPSSDGTSVICSARRGEEKKISWDIVCPLQRPISSGLSPCSNLRPVRFLACLSHCVSTCQLPCPSCTMGCLPYGSQAFRAEGTENSKLQKPRAQTRVVQYFKSLYSFQ